MVTGSKELDASKRLIAFLASDKATAAIKKAGMERKDPSARTPCLGASMATSEVGRVSYGVSGISVTFT